MNTMNSIVQLETYANELSCAARSLVAHCQNANISSTGPQLRIPEDAPRSIHQDRQKILGSLAKLQVLLRGPDDFLQQMALQIQMLASVQWLSSLQVLVCLPLAGSLALKDLAQLAGVPETQLSRVIRLTASGGFLQEPQPGQIRHTPLSTVFVSQRRFRDATMFLAECCTPSALRMASTMHPHVGSSAEVPCASAYSLAFSTSVPFLKACSSTPKLQRQWSAFLQYTGDFEEKVTEVLSRLDWAHLGDCCIVESGAQSAETAKVLSELYPGLQIIVQTETRSSDSAHPPASLEAYNPRITLQTRALGMPQPVLDAAAYILRLPPSSWESGRSLVLMELQSYCTILAANRRAMLILTARMLPQPGTVDREIETIARMRDMILFQLGAERDPEVSEVVDLVGSVGDAQGRLVIVDRLRARNNLAVALAVKYQGWSELDGVLAA
ncbi:hypothetical protein EYZ11_006296 [Aspergillus tanneri]|uniref:O-methyltransferase domain-containing protein n=1 Tax=Aspergillus tanneri TaxID=1220188 RepID=A0A4S3JGF8_9EURO|nr:uncharacterized protein ATNIH1004_008022 [Aspergillus tanneri]KAA8646589.1 hypothetical protein ATNIH1004_008022 [Aspergillus tanneri]THC94245.1 hypothetical protein EYZ11_006296 [Aspergillus tanneri]